MTPQELYIYLVEIVQGLPCYYIDAEVSERKYHCDTLPNTYYSPSLQFGDCNGEFIVYTSGSGKQDPIEAIKDAQQWCAEHKEEILSLNKDAIL